MTRTRAALLLVLAVALAAPATGSAYIYWALPGHSNTSDFGSLGHANLDGTGATDNYVTGTASAWDLAIDGSHMFWTNLGTQSIGRADLDGSNANPRFLPNVGIPSVASANQLDVQGDYVYYGRSETHTTTDWTIMRARTDGTGTYQTLIDFGSANVDVDGIDVTPSYIYWSDSHNGIGRANLDGTGANGNFITGIGSVSQVTTDGRYLYWIDAYNRRIGRANINGTGVNASFISGPSLNLGRGLAVDDSHIYWSQPASSVSGFVGRANLDGSGVSTTFAPTGYSVQGISVDPLPYDTVTRLACAPASLDAGRSTTCTVTVSNANGGVGAPGGEVTLATEAHGSFGPGPKCTLVPAGETSTCQVTFIPFDGGQAQIAASYGGEYAHAASSGEAALQVAGLGTKIKDADIDRDAGSATFTFGDSADGTSRASGAFECALVKRRHAKPRFKSCRSPKRYKHLKRGSYVFQVRAVVGDAADTTPAKRKFRI